MHASELGDFLVRALRPNAGMLPGIGCAVFGGLGLGLSGLDGRGLGVQAGDDGVNLVLGVEMHGVKPCGGADGVGDDRIAFDPGLRERRVGAVGGPEDIEADKAVQRLRQAVRPLQEDARAGRQVERHGMI